MNTMNNFKTMKVFDCQWDPGMPEDVRQAFNPVESYRNYYRGDKAYIAKWTKRSVPNWW
jgi:hypothetical protein